VKRNVCEITGSRCQPASQPLAPYPYQEIKQEDDGRRFYLFPFLLPWTRTSVTRTSLPDRSSPKMPLLCLLVHVPVPIPILVPYPDHNIDFSIYNANIATAATTASPAPADLSPLAAPVYTATGGPVGDPPYPPPPLYPPYPPLLFDGGPPEAPPGGPDPV